MVIVYRVTKIKIYFLCWLTVEAVGGKALPCAVDVRDESQVRSAVKKAIEMVN